MGYYRGAGDYYRAGRGSIFSAIGHVVGTAVKIGLGAGTGFLTGGGVKGAIVGAAGAAGLATRENITRETLAAGGEGSAYTPAMRAQHARLLGAGSAAHPIGSHPAGTPAGKSRMIGPPVSAGMGQRISKRQAKALRESGVPARASPTLNPFNPHALRRAARRAHSFLRMSRRLVRYYTARHPKGKAYIHTKRRAK